jgi:hypothetical protein
MKSLATIFALAAVAVPSAYAEGPPMSDVQLSRPSIAQQFAGTAPLSDVQLSRPAIAHRYVTPAPVSDVQLSRYGSRTATAVLIASPDTGFNWADASIGAAVMFGATLLALTAALAVRSTRGRFQRA